jgi:hypothetical protein
MAKTFTYSPFKYKKYDESYDTQKSKLQKSEAEKILEGYGDYVESDAVKKAEQAKANADLVLSNHGDFQYSNQGDLDSIMRNILERKDFSYDLNGDALYQQYKDKYTQQGKMASRDVMGQAAAMTGGYGNSYAQSVGNQAYQASLENLNDIVPELYQMAYDRYIQEGQDMYNKYGLISGERDNQYGMWSDKYNRLANDRAYYANAYDTERSVDYGKWSDGYNRLANDRSYYADAYNTERNFDYGKYADDRTFDYGKYLDDKSYAYQTLRDEITDEQWLKNFEEARRQFDKQMSSKSTSGSGDEEGNISDNTISFDDWSQSDWNSYFSIIRNSDGRDAAEKELDRMIKAGLIPEAMISSASVGARGTRGH